MIPKTGGIFKWTVILPALLLAAWLVYRTKNAESPAPAVSSDLAPQKSGSDQLVGITGVIEVPVTVPVESGFTAPRNDTGKRTTHSQEFARGQSDDSSVPVEQPAGKASARLPGLDEFRASRGALIKEIGELLESTEKLGASERTKAIQEWRNRNGNRLAEDAKRAYFFQEKSLDEYQEIIAENGSGHSPSPAK